MLSNFNPQSVATHLAAAVLDSTHQPDEAFVVSPGTVRVVAVKKGELGYHALDHQKHHPSEAAAWRAADELNAGIGVTRRQSRAALHGSLFGWSVPGADPAAYDADGRLIPRGPTLG